MQPSLGQGLPWRVRRRVSGLEPGETYPRQVLRALLQRREFRAPRPVRPIRRREAEPGSAQGGGPMPGGGPAGPWVCREPL